MNATDTATVDRVEQAVIAANEAWETGRAPSPSALDYLMVAHGALLEDRNYRGDLFQHREAYADSLFEALNDGTLDSTREIAEWLVEKLTA